MTVTSHPRPRLDEEEKSDRTPVKTAARPARPRPLEDEDDRPRRPRAVRIDPDQDDRPRRPRPRYAEDEEEPQPRRRKKRSPSFPWVGALVGGGVVVGLVMVVVVGAGIWSLVRSQANINPADWQKVDRPEMGFQVLLPGTPRQSQNSLDTPVGKIEQHKFIVEPKGKNELFMIVSTQFPDEVGRRLGGPQRILELGRKDLLAAQPAQLKSEKPIALNGYSGVELELVPAKGAIMKARVYARNNQIFEVLAGVPEIRASSEDVQKFFDSFQMSAQPATVPSATVAGVGDPPPVAVPSTTVAGVGAPPPVAIPSTTVGGVGAPPSVPVTLPPGQK